MGFKKAIFFIIGLGLTAAAFSEAEFSAAEQALLKSHGPWPPAPVVDESNRYSANPKAIELGEFLFNEVRLSATGSIACASCHIESLAYTDAQQLATGIEPVNRNTPTVVNSGLWHWFGWDGAADSLWLQSVRPIQSPQEMDGAKGAVRKLYETDPDYRTASMELFGAEPESLSDELLLVSTGKALAAYQATLISERSAFDDFRDAWLAGDESALSQYPESARRGAKIFLGSGRCSVCHFGPLFSNGEFANIGIPHRTRDGGVDKGRFAGLQSLKRNPFNLASQYNDDASQKSAVKTLRLKRRHDSFGEFRVPSLRGVSNTAPYMHNGSVATLEEVVRHYSELDLDRIHVSGDGLLRPLNLNNQQQSDLVSFLKTL